MPKHAITVGIVAIGLIAAVVIVRAAHASAGATPGRATDVGLDAARAIAAGLTPRPIPNGAQIREFFGRSSVNTSLPFRGIA